MAAIDKLQGRRPLLGLFVVPALIGFLLFPAGFFFGKYAALSMISTGQAGAAQAVAAAQQGLAGGGAGTSLPPSGRCSDVPCKAMASWRSSPHVNAAASYQPALTARELERGVVSYGDTSRLRRAMAKLLAGQAISVTTVGGSITAGTGVKKPWQESYAPRVFAWINETFPNSPHRLVNNGFGAIPSSYFSLCCNHHVASDVDLVFLETNINDGAAGRDSPPRRAHERLIRKLLNYPNRPAVAEIVFWPYPKPDFYDVSAGMPFRFGGDDEIGVLAQFYHLPWLGTRSLLWNGLREARADPAADPEPGKLDGFFYVSWDGFFDALHPGDFGHRVLADLVIHLLQRVLQDVAERPLEAEDEQEAQAELPAPMHRHNWEASGSNTCLMREDMHAVITSKDDAFEYRNEGTEQLPKWGWISTQPGSSLQVTINTNVTQRLKPSDYVGVGVAHLKSYEHMGMFSVSCVEGCTCEPLQVDGHFPSEKHSQLHMTGMQVTAADACKLKLTVQNETQSGEHKVKLLGLVISEDSQYLITFDKSLMMGTASGAWER